MPNMIQRGDVAYAWGAKTGTRMAHCFRHAKVGEGMEGPGRKPWESLCLEKLKTQDLGWASDYRRAKQKDKRCPACLKMIVKLGIQV